MSVDFLMDEWKIFINGKNDIFNYKPDDRKLDNKMTGNSSQSMIVRLGHYYFDNKPLIGKMVNFHMWNRFIIHSTGCPTIGFHQSYYDYVKL